MKKLVELLLEGEGADAVELCRDMIGNGVAKKDIVTEAVEAAMNLLDDKCSVEQFNLLEIMLVGRAAMEVMKFLYPQADQDPTKAAVIAVASLEGDVHDLGKNILKMILSSKGYRVNDYGKDCRLDTLVEKAAADQVEVIGVSGLITTIIPQIQKIRPALKDKGLDRIKIIAGGAALKQSTAETLNVDFVAETAFDGAHYIDKISGD